MANYYGVGRSNYFRVKDTAAFEKWAGEIISLEIITDEEKVGFMIKSDDGCLPSFRFPKEGEEIETEIDFLAELAEHLGEGEVAIFQHVGHEKHRYLSGSAVAINSAGEQIAIDIYDIYEQAKSLGKHITKVEY